jgi:hypothetical protein
MGKASWKQHLWTTTSLEKKGKGARVNKNIAIAGERLH